MARVTEALIVIWAVVSLAFVLNELLPGDPARWVAGLQARPADVARIRSQLGLDQPPALRYARFWLRAVHVGPAAAPPDGSSHESCARVVAVGTHALHVDLGKSLQRRQPVVAILASRWPRTMALAIAGTVLQVVFGVGAGLLAAAMRGRWLDRALIGATLLGVSTPTFLTAWLLQLVLARHLRWLPLDGYGTTLAEHARCLILPALTLGIFGSAYYARLSRDEVVSRLRSDWVRTARAKGAPPIRVLGAHVLRNALIPVVTAIGTDFGTLVGGAIVTETVFRWPGLGELSLRATLDRDGPVLFGCVVVTAVAVVVSQLAVDAAYAWLDPRIKAQRGRGTR